MWSFPPLFRPDPAMPPLMREPRPRQTWCYVTGAAELPGQTDRESEGADTLHVLGLGPIAVCDDQESDEERVRTIVGVRPDDFGQANDVIAFFVGIGAAFATHELSPVCPAPLKTRAVRPEYG